MSSPTIPFWNYQSQYAWTSTDGILTDQSRLWIQTLYRRVMSTSGGGGGFTAGGDLSGTNTVQTVIGIEGRPVAATAPTDGQVLTWVQVDGKWEPKTPASTGGASVAVEEIPAGTIDGVNKVFTLSHAPTPSNALLLFVNGVEQKPGTDYTLSGATITYAIAPKTTDWHLAWYEYGGSGAGGITQLVIGFVITNGATGTNVGPMLAAPHSGTVSSCTVTIKTSDSSTALTFTIRKNGASVFASNPTVAAGTASGTVLTVGTLTSIPLSSSANDVFSIDITSGTSAWQFTAQLE